MKVVIFLFTLVSSFSSLADCYLSRYSNSVLELNSSMSREQMLTVINELLNEKEVGDVPKKGFKFAYTASGNGRIFINKYGSDNPHHGELNAYCRADTAGYLRLKKKNDKLKIEVDNKSILYCDKRYHGLSSLAPIVYILGQLSTFYGDEVEITMENNKANCLEL